MINEKIQQLITQNERVLSHFNSRVVLSDSSLLDCFLETSKTLQEVSALVLSFDQDIESLKSQIVATTEVKKMLSSLLFDKQEDSAKEVLTIQHLGNLCRTLITDNKQIKLENARLLNDLEQIKQLGIKQF